jgi:putative intracellular protease/amidase
MSTTNYMDDASAEKAAPKTSRVTARLIAVVSAGAALLVAAGILAAASLSSATNAEAQMYGWSCQAGWHAINAPNGNGYRCVPDNY